MEKKTKLFIIIAIAINIILCLGWIAHSQLTRIAADFTIPELSDCETDAAAAGDKATAGSTPANTYTGSGYSSGTARTGTTPGLTGEKKQVADAVQAKVGRKISSRDMLRAGLILWGGLPREDFKYVYAVGRKDNATPEELQKVRDILLNNLTEEDLADLKNLGYTYGKSLQILDPSVPITKTPAKAPVTES